MDEVSGTKYNENLNAKDLYNKFEKILRPNIRKNIIIETFFNIYLVFRNKRKICLLDSQPLNLDIYRNKISKFVKKNFGKTLDIKPWGVWLLIHNKLVEINEYMNEIQFGELLGYFTPGDILNDIPLRTFLLTILVENFQLTVEFSRSRPNQDLVENKIKEFQDVANELDWKVSHTIEKKTILKTLMFLFNYSKYQIFELDEAIMNFLHKRLIETDSKNEILKYFKTLESILMKSYSEFVENFVFDEFFNYTFPNFFQIIGILEKIEHKFFILKNDVEVYKDKQKKENWQILYNLWLKNNKNEKLIDLLVEMFSKISKGKIKLIEKVNKMKKIFNDLNELVEDFNEDPESTRNFLFICHECGEIFIENIIEYFDNWCLNS